MDLSKGMIDKIRTRTDLLVLKKLTVEHGHGVCRFFFFYNCSFNFFSKFLSKLFSAT